MTSASSLRLFSLATWRSLLDIAPHCLVAFVAGQQPAPKADRTCSVSVHEEQKLGASEETEARSIDSWFPVFFSLPSPSFSFSFFFTLLLCFADCCWCVDLRCRSFRYVSVCRRARACVCGCVMCVCGCVCVCVCMCVCVCAPVVVHRLCAAV